MHLKDRFSPNKNKNWKEIRNHRNISNGKRLEKKYISIPLFVDRITDNQIRCICIKCSFFSRIHRTPILDTINTGQFFFPENAFVFVSLEEDVQFYTEKFVYFLNVPYFFLSADPEFLLPLSPFIRFTATIQTKIVSETWEEYFYYFEMK